MASVRTFVLSILIALTIGCGCSDGYRILGLFPLNGKSHHVMCEKLIIGLAKAGHQVDVYTHFPLKNPIPNLKEYSLAGTRPVVQNNVTYAFLQSIIKFDFGHFMNLAGYEICQLMETKQFTELFARLRKEQPYDLVIVEIFAANCYIAWGRHMNVPIIGVQTSALLDWLNGPLGNPFNTAVHPSAWSTAKAPMNFWERLTNTLGVNVFLAMYNYHVRTQDELVEKYFGPGYPNAAELPKDLDLMLVNSYPTLDGIKAHAPAIVPVAGIHIEDKGEKLPQEVQKWLDESKSGCIYISFGSMVRLETFPKEVMDSFYEMFRRIAPVRVLFKIAKPEDLPKGLPSNVMTQSWFAQLQVLKHKNLKAFVSHGGLMSTQETLSAGVPVIGVPLFGDQHTNILSQVRRGTATHVSLDNLNANTLTDAVKKVLNDPSYDKKAKEYAKSFYDRPMKPLDTAIFWVEYIARHGKGALRSPEVDMPWWQTNLIDVYGFILLVIGVILYILKLIIKKVLSCFRPSSKKNKRE